MKAAIYSRISLDRTGEQAGVERQLEDCRKLAADTGWIVVEEFIDNDISASSGKLRPRYQAMLQAIDQGEVDAIVTWAPDRLYRKLADLEPLIIVMERSGCTLRTVRAGEIDMATPTGRMLARILASVATAEGEVKSDRWRRSIQQRREKGQPPGWGSRLYGYTLDGQLVPHEADNIRWAATQILEGRTLRSTANDLTARGQLSTKGNPWTVPALRKLLANPRLAGHSTLNGNIVGTGNWDPILTAEQHTQLAALFGVRRNAQPRPRLALLAGIIHCGGTLGDQPCPNKLTTARNTQGDRIYRCKSAAGHPGCNGCQILAEPLEQMVEAAAQLALSDPRVRANLTAMAALTGEHTAEIITLEDRLVELERQYETPGIAVDAISRSISRVRDRIDELRAKITAPNVPLAGDWPNDLGRRARLVRLVVADVIVAPTPVRGRKGFDGSRVDIRPVVSPGGTASTPGQ